MKSKVFFVPVSESDSIQILQNRLLLLLNKSGCFDNISVGDKTVVKIHFGEEGNTGFVSPQYVAVVCKQLLAAGATTFLSDSNTLYRGRRVESNDHRMLALEHGFTKDTTGADVIIADESVGAVSLIPLNLQFVKEAKIPKCYLDTNLFISIAHFKGHMMSGIGGALKNIGMGCATREGKLIQHSDIAPMVYKDRCTGCGVCTRFCQVNAISLVNSIARINSAYCTGCAACIAVCTFGAMEVDWDRGSMLMQEKMVEYAAAVLRTVPRAIHINFATKITAECDCIAKDDPRIVNDLGIFISEDPVAIDQACYDMVIEHAGNDVFKVAHPTRDGNRQLMYAERLGLGSRKYELVTIAQ